MSYDLVICGASILDGTGSDAFSGDIAIADGRIAAIGSVSGGGKIEIRAEGLTVSPGFIDVHTHDDRLLLIDPAVQPKVSQGVTTVVTGNCGISLAPLLRDGPPPAPLTLLGGRSDLFFKTFKDYVAALESRACAVNAAPFVGHSSLRVCAMDTLDRPASADEIAAMTALLEEGMAAGAFGLTTGLYYPPAAAAPPSEVEALLRVVADRGGMYATHMRDEGDKLVASIEETIGSARVSGVPLVISHLKCASPAMWGKSAEIVAMIDRASQTQSIAFDVYPYEASSTMLRADAVAGSRKVVVTWSDTHPDKSGQDLEDVARCWCCSPEEAVTRLSPGGGLYYRMQERDVRRILSHPNSMIGSDGLPHDTHPHPRLWGTFPRVLGRYVRDLKILSLPAAIRKMTSLPASVFGLADRGQVKEGLAADLVVFDPNKILEKATYDMPKQQAQGVAHVIVNGEIVFADGAATGARPGRVLRRAA